MNYELSIDLIKRLFVFGAIAFLLAAPKTRAEPLAGGSKSNFSPSLENRPIPSPRLSSSNYRLDQLKNAPAGLDDLNVAAFEAIVQEFGSEYVARLNSPDRADLTDAAAFADRDRFDLRAMTATYFLQPPSQSEIINYFSQRFASDGFNFTPVGTYGGGQSYQVTRGEFSRCMIFAPTNIPSDTQGTPGTAVILSESCP